MRSNFFASFIVTICFCCLTMRGATQPDSLEVKRNHSNYFRFKALGYVIIEDDWVSSVSIGIEHKFSPSFGFVVDIVHHRWKHEREVHDQPDPEQYSEYAQRDIRNFLAFEFRYYPFVKREKKDNHFYFNVYSKIGLRRLFVEDKFPLVLNDQIQVKGHFADFGASIGFSKGTRFLADINVGAAYRIENYNEEVYIGGYKSEFRNGTGKLYWTPNVRFTFALLIGGSKANK